MGHGHDQIPDPFYQRWASLVVVLDWYTRKIGGYQVGLPSKSGDWLEALDQAHRAIENWIWNYHHLYPYSALGYLSPVEFEPQISTSKAV